MADKHDPADPEHFGIMDLFDSDEDDFDEPDDDTGTNENVDEDEDEGRYRAGAGIAPGIVGAGAVAALVLAGLTWWAGRASAAPEPGTSTTTVTQPAQTVTGSGEVRNKFPRPRLVSCWPPANLACPRTVLFPSGCRLSRRERIVERIRRDLAVSAMSRSTFFAP